ncbi:MAG: DNA-binding protein [Planctomycetes bacterium]|nr:DNA-binding protein [Planctomycetota bacterium]
MPMEFLSVPEAGKRLGVGRARAYQLAKAGYLPTVRVSARRYLVPADALDRLGDAAIARAAQKGVNDEA